MCSLKFPSQNLQPLLYSTSDTLQILRIARSPDPTRNASCLDDYAYSRPVLEGRQLNVRGSGCFVECSILGLGKQHSRPVRSREVKADENLAFDDASFEFEGITKRDCRDGGEFLIKVMEKTSYGRERDIGEGKIPLSKVIDGLERKPIRLDGGGIVRVSARFEENKGYGSESDYRDDTSKKLEVDMKVEARYRGKSKYYPGTISRVRLNGTVDINYDDGEKELGVNPEFVRVVEEKRSRSQSSSSSASHSSSSSHNKFNKNDIIECRYKKKAKYYPATISRVHRDGTYDVSYESSSKDKERNVNSKYIRPRSSRSRGRSPASGSSDSKRLSGDAREARLARFEGKSRSSKSKSVSRSKSRRRSPSSSSSSSDSASTSRNQPQHYDFAAGDKVKCCYYRSSNASKYSKPKKNSRYLPAKIRRHNKDSSTYKVEFSSGNVGTINDVPAKYIKIDSLSPSSSSASPPRSGRRSRSWDNLLALANYHYDDRNRSGRPPSLSSSHKASRGDDYKKLESLLGRSNLNDYRDKFEQYDMGRRDELEYEDVVSAFDALGRRCSLSEVKHYARSARLNSRALSFLDFMKCYATLFFSSSSSHSDEDGETSSLRRKNMDSFLTDEASDLQQWAAVLGDKQLQILEDVFSDHATPLVRADGSTSARVGIRVRELRSALRDLNRDCSASTLSAFLTSSSLKPGDVLSLADFAYTYHALFGDGGVDNVFSGAAARSGPFGTFDKRTSSTSHRHGQALSLGSISETAAAIFSQALEWQGSPDQHLSLIRKLSIGRGDHILNALRSARDAFESLDEDDLGEIPISLVTDWLSDALPHRKVKNDDALTKLIRDFEVKKTGGNESSTSKKGKASSRDDSEEENKNDNDSGKSSAGFFFFFNFAAGSCPFFPLYSSS